MVTLVGIPFGKKANEVHSSNAESPIVVTVSGIFTDSREEHCSNAEFPIVFNPLDSFTDSRDRQFENVP